MSKDNNMSDNDSKMIEEAFENLMQSLRAGTTEENKQLIRDVFAFANKAHWGMRRRSGEPYIMHPIAVAKIVASEIGLGTKAVVSALLHDVVEDTEYTVEDMERMYGKKIASIVDGLTKIKGAMDHTESSQAESFRKIILTIADDVRVILIKIADRLHNMRTLASMPTSKQMKIASETLYIYAPLAHRMGLHAIKSELEDLSLRYEHPEEYVIIEKYLDEYYSQYIDRYTGFIEAIDRKLVGEMKYDCSITVRRKSVYSVWYKMQKHNIGFNDIYDLLAVRIIFTPKEGMNEKVQCWGIYSSLTDIYSPKPERIRDMVSVPKANGYEAIHVTVMSGFGQWAEVQIRSRRMDEIAERGLPAQWKYKSESGAESELDKWLTSIKGMLTARDSDAIEFVKEFKLNLFAKEIRVFTPKGYMITLPKGAVVLDFAYNIHSHVGNTCIGAKVNHKLVPMNSRLSSGDQVEILTSSRQSPQREWLDYVVTAKAKSEISAIFRKERTDMIKRGMAMFNIIAQNLKLNQPADILNKLMQVRKIAGKDELYIQIANQLITQDDIAILLNPKKNSSFMKYWKLQFFGGNKVSEEEDSHAKHETAAETGAGEFVISPCCSPIPGDDVVGLEMGGKVMVHKRKCPEAIRLMSNYGDKIVPVQWTMYKTFLVVVKIEGIDRIGVVSDITAIISQEKDIRLQMVHFEADNGIFNGNLNVFVRNKADLERLIGRISELKGVDKVNRVENAEAI